VLDYVVQYRVVGTTTWIVVPDGVSTTRSVTIGGLTPATTYEVRVAAVNARGTGPFSTPSYPDLVPGVPTAPRDLVASPRSGGASLTWRSVASSNGYSVSDYVIEYRLVGAATWTPLPDSVSTSRSRTVTGLPNGAEYEFRVAAVNRLGAGPWTEPVALVTGAPTAPGRPSASAEDGYTVRLAWSSPSSSNGASVVDYVIQYRLVGSDTWVSYPDEVSTQRVVWVWGLPAPRMYEFRVAAVNARGQGPWSATSTAVVVMFE
jgi:titin